MEQQCKQRMFFGFRDIKVESICNEIEQQFIVEKSKPNNLKT